MNPLATQQDVEARIGPLNAEQLARIDGLIEDAGTLIRAECHLAFDLVPSDEATLRSSGNVIILPERPVNDVTKVVAVGVPPTQDLTMPTGSYSFDGIDKITVHTNLGWIINLPEVWSTNDWAGAGTYKVTYSHGEVIVDDRIKTMVCRMVGRTLTAPTVSDLVSESVGAGDYAWQANQATGAMGSGVRLTAGDINQLRRWGFIRTAGTTETVLQ